MRILLINLGSPKSLSIIDVKEYLREFLSDDCVVDLPKYLQQIILQLFILPFRPKKTKLAYEQIWSEKGSPLIYNTQLIANKLKESTGIEVDIAMRYQEPSIKSYIIKMKEQNEKELIVIPLYPHNAMSTTVSINIEFEKLAHECYNDLNYTIIQPFYNKTKYIEALGESIKPYLDDNIDKLIFSYHGIPERHIKKSDLNGNHCLKSIDCCKASCNSATTCYRSNVYKTSLSTAKYLNLVDHQWCMTFQSRVSIIDPRWLKPYTDKHLSNLPKSNICNIAIVCPSFVADCLETIEEINIRGKETFLNAGGESFKYIPCLNDSLEFINLLSDLIDETI